MPKISLLLNQHAPVTIRTMHKLSSIEGNCMQSQEDH